MREPTRPDDTRAELIRRLDSFEVGFYAVANDVRAGRLSLATAATYLRRGHGHAARLALADDIDRYEEANRGS